MKLKLFFTLSLLLGATFMVRYETEIVFYIILVIGSNFYG